MSKRLFLMAIVGAILFAGCKDNKSETLADILVGTWTLEGYEPATKAITIGAETVSVTVTFSEDNSFILIQKIGQAFTETFEGTWSVDGTTLSGEYSDKKPWGEQYYISFIDSNNTLEMKTVTAGERYFYQRYIPKE